MVFQVDLNSDMGESFGAYTIGCDSDVIKQVTSANIACGWHAGDPQVLDNSIAMAKERGVAIGAHPGYPDLLGFGRRNLNVTQDEEYVYVLYQLGAFFAFAKKHGMEIQHLKAHGAMYNMAGKDIRLAIAICKAVKDFDPQIILLGLAGSKLIEAAKEIGLRSASEVFADRAYEEDGSLVDRAKPGAMVNDEDLCISRVVRMVKEGKVEAITGKDIAVKTDSICVHGDGPQALAFTTRIREALTTKGVRLVNFGSFVE
ncbi:MAG: 5-oxoprolinase subunit PxpA [Spirochaetales bacterium]|nr:MAG: 5-oxoprolinase subunit PxpA [Spirochaetales bacterium]